MAENKTLDEAFAEWQATDQGKRFSNPEYMGASTIHVQRWWHVLYTVFGYARAEGAAQLASLTAELDRLQQENARLKAIEEVEQSPPNIMETIDELRAISGGCWDNVDPDEYIRSLRGEPELEAQLATLTAERDELRAKYDKLREQVDRRGLGIND